MKTSRDFARELLDLADGDAGAAAVDRLTKAVESRDRALVFEASLAFATDRPPVSPVATSVLVAALEELAAMFYVSHANGQQTKIPHAVRSIAARALAAFRASKPNPTAAPAPAPYEPLRVWCAICGVSAGEHCSGTPRGSFHGARHEAAIASADTPTIQAPPLPPACPTCSLAATPNPTTCSNGFHAPLPQGEAANNSAATFRHELESALNRCSMENGSNTPDFMLAKFLAGCLEAFDVGVRERETWYGRDPDRKPGQPPSTPESTPSESPAVCNGECGAKGTGPHVHGGPSTDATKGTP